MELVNACPKMDGCNARTGATLGLVQHWNWCDAGTGVMLGLA